MQESGLINSGIYEKKLLNKFDKEVKENSFTKEIKFPNINTLENKSEAENIVNKDYSGKTYDFRLGHAIAQINNMFIVSQTRDKVILIDQHAAHERIVLEKLKSSFLHNSVQRQILLMPEILEIDENIKLFLDNRKKIEKLGIVFEDYGQNSLLIRELPSILGKVNVRRVI